MKFDRLVYRETASGAAAGQPDSSAPCGAEPENVLTVDFGGIGELTLKSGPRGDVNWRRITHPVLDVLRSKLDACEFDAWRDDYSAPSKNDHGWGLELFDGETSVKRIAGGGDVPERWPVFLSLLELCGALAENRRQSLLHQCADDARAHVSPRDGARHGAASVEDLSPKARDARLTNRKQALY